MASDLKRGGVLVALFTECLLGDTLLVHLPVLLAVATRARTGEGPRTGLRQPNRCLGITFLNLGLVGNCQC